ncbi:hypothetical protein BH09BAC3_BH09BAC3_07470 [soil metagenome]
MKYKLAFYFFLFTVLFCCAQSEKSVEIQKRLDQYSDHYQPEYTKLVFDKDLYFAGEKIWYSLWLWNDTNTSSSLSILVYVEIRDKNDSVLMRQKVKCKHGKAYGELSLPDRFPTGYYKIVAFTSWMRNVGSPGRYEHFIPIINREHPITKGSTTKIPERKSVLAVSRENPHSIKIGIPEGITGELLVINSQEVVYNKAIVNSAPILISLDIITNPIVTVLLFNTQGSIVDEQKLTNENVSTYVSVTASNKPALPRSSTDIFIELKDEDGHLINGNVSVSVRPKGAVVKQQGLDASSANYESVLTKELVPLTYRKEIFIYPPSANTLPGVDFSSSMRPQPYEFSFQTGAGARIISEADLRKKITTYYSVNAFYEVEDDYNFKSNNSFETKKYAVLPTLEEFFRELVAQVKVKKLKGETVLRVRNSDNPAKIYFFNGSPMIIIDKVSSTASELLSIPLSDVDRIDVIWSTDAINALGIFSLADNGLVSVSTKSRIKYSQSKGEVFKDLHLPLKFSIPAFSDKEKFAPVMIDPLFWSPSVLISGKTKVTINTSDDLGLFLVEVKGITETGDHISGMTQINVSVDPN